MQTLQLTYAVNIAIQTLALIFVNTELKGDGKTYKLKSLSDDIVSETLVYDNAEARAETVRQTCDMLGFD